LQLPAQCTSIQTSTACAKQNATLSKLPMHVMKRKSLFIHSRQMFALLASSEIRNRLKAPTHHRLRSLGRSWLMHVHGAGMQDSKHKLGPQPASKRSSPCVRLAAHSSGQVAHELIGMGTRRRSWHQARPWRGHDYRYGGARGNGVRLACSVQGRMHTVAPSFEIHERQRGAAG
jgi:hypothetical protein